MTREEFLRYTHIPAREHVPAIINLSAASAIGAEWIRVELYADVVPPSTVLHFASYVSIHKQNSTGGEDVEVLKNRWQPFAPPDTGGVLVRVFDDRRAIMPATTGYDEPVCSMLERIHKSLCQAGYRVHRQ